MLVVLAFAPAGGTTTPLRAPDCKRASLAPSVDTNGAGGTIIVYAILRNTSGRTCLARGRVTLALRDAKTHRLLVIKGNPHSKQVDGPVRPGRNNVFALQWSNYCGPGKPMLFETTFAHRRARQASHYPGARCETPDAPSTLRLFRLPG